MLVLVRLYHYFFLCWFSFIVIISSRNELEKIRFLMCSKLYAFEELSPSNLQICTDVYYHSSADGVLFFWGNLSVEHSWLVAWSGKHCSECFCLFCDLVYGTLHGVL
jgi:hypothetical protein